MKILIVALLILNTMYNNITSPYAHAVYVCISLLFNNSSLVKILNAKYKYTKNKTSIRSCNMLNRTRNWGETDC